VQAPITSSSREDSQKLQKTLRRQIGPDAKTIDTRVSSAGTEKMRHRIGDYFHEIVIFSQENSNQFRLVFQRRPEAEPFWKDIMVRIVRALETDSGATVSLDYQGDVALDWMTPIAK
jgi:hypothetical protein